jgi:hypothetical protein
MFTFGEYTPWPSPVASPADSSAAREVPASPSSRRMPFVSPGASPDARVSSSTSVTTTLSASRPLQPRPTPASRTRQYRNGASNDIHGTSEEDGGICSANRGKYSSRLTLRRSCSHRI